MERESFEDEEVARALNQEFVAVKVDREERPDVDATFMEALLLVNGGRGGWPLTMFVTPGRQPVIGFTYLPPRDGERGMGVGLLTVLQRLARQHAEDPQGASAQAARVAEALRQESAAGAQADRALFEAGNICRLDNQCLVQICFGGRLVPETSLGHGQ